MTQRLLFEDEGSRVRGAITSLLVGIDSETERGRKNVWLFATGFWNPQDHCGKGGSMIKRYCPGARRADAVSPSLP